MNPQDRIRDLGAADGKYGTLVPMQAFRAPAGTSLQRAVSTAILGTEVSSEKMIYGAFALENPLREATVLNVEPGATVRVTAKDGENVAVEAAETAASVELTGDVSEVTAVPRELALHANFSRQAYHTPQTFNLIMGNLSRAIFDKIGHDVFTGPGTSQGITNLTGRLTVTAVANANANRQFIRSLQTALDDANIDVDGRAWFTGNLAHYDLLDQQQSGQISRPLMETDRVFVEDSYGQPRGLRTINGEPAHRTGYLDNKPTGNNNDTSGIIYGNFKDAVVVIWGGIEFWVDDMTQTNVVTLHAFTEYDIVFPRPQSFVTSTITGF